MDTTTIFHDNGSSTVIASSPADNETDDYSSYYNFDDFFDWHTASILPTLLYLTFFDVTALMGVIGNVMILMVTRHRSLCSLSYCVYLRFLAVSDTAVIMFSVLQVNLDRFHNIYQRMLTWNLRFCQTFMVLRYWSSFLSLWLVVATTCDRFMAVVFPLKRKVTATKMRASIKCMALVLVTLFYNLSHYYTSDLVSDEYEPEKVFCSYSKDTRVVADILTLLCGYILPCALIFFLNMLTLFYIRLSARQRDKLIASSGQSVQPRTVISVVSESSANSREGNITSTTEQSFASTTKGVSEGKEMPPEDDHADGKAISVLGNQETEASGNNRKILSKNNPGLDRGNVNSSNSGTQGVASNPSVPPNVPSKVGEKKSQGEEINKKSRVDRATVCLTYISVSAFITVTPYAIMHLLFMLLLDQWDTMLAVNPFTPVPLVLQNLVRAWDLLELIGLLNFCQNFYILLLTNRLVFQTASEMFGCVTGKKSLVKYKQEKY